jgi:hypothetical protein
VAAGTDAPSVPEGEKVPGITARNASTAPRRAKAAGLLEDLAGVQLTVKRVERAAGASGAAQAAAVRDRAWLIAGRKIVPLPPQPLADMLYGAIDGTGVTMTAKETAGREGKGEDGRARTREVKLAVFFTQDDVDEKGYPVRDRDPASYIATLPPPANTPSRASRKTRSAPRSATSRTTPAVCAVSGSGPAACSAAPASSSPAARRSSASASTVRHALDRYRRRHHRHPALPAGQRPEDRIWQPRHNQAVPA